MHAQDEQTNSKMIGTDKAGSITVIVSIYKTGTVCVRLVHDREKKAEKRIKVTEKK